MISSRSKSSPAGIASPHIFLLVAFALLWLPAAALAAPEGEEGPPASPLPQLAFEPGSYDFGLQPANNYGGEANLQLRNVGESSAPVQSLEISGGNGAFWTGNSDCWGRTLNPGDACYVQVHFGPNGVDGYAAQLRASSDYGTSFNAELSGEGGRAVLTPSSEPTNFGSTPVGGPPVLRAIEITNTGRIGGSVFIAVISGGAVGSFQLLDENCTGVLIAPDASCNALVAFQPLSTGSKTARFSLFGDGDGGTQITLSGIGLEPQSFAAAGAASERAAGKSSGNARRTRVRARARTKRRRAMARQRRRQRRALRHRRIFVALARPTR